MDVEIVTHCWHGPDRVSGQYAKLLVYQISSLYLHQPACDVRLTVVVAEEDAVTRRVLEWFGALRWPPNIHLRPLLQHREFALQRPHGRNLRAKQTDAGIVWFADCDYVFGQGCLDALASQNPRRMAKLCFPRFVLGTITHERGDCLISAVNLDDIEPLDVDPRDFEKMRVTKAIGGCQIVPGRIAREFGYLPDNGVYQEPRPDVDTIVGFTADKAYRKQLGTNGRRVDVPNCFRIRHSVVGDGRHDGKVGEVGDATAVV